MIIDSHVHLLSEPGYIEKLILEMDKLGIDKVCLLAMQQVPIWGSIAASNEQLLDAYAKYPDRIIPFGYVDLGVDPVNLIDQLADAGCKGLKITRTRFDYNANELMEYYAHASARRMVILFHTGTVLRTSEDQYLDIDSSRLRPIFLDRIARKFPDMNIIGAHLGNPWYEEAAMTLFWNPNVYFDLSGTLLARKNAAWFKETLWWDPERMSQLARDANSHYTVSHPFDRICFGTDVPVQEMKYCLVQYRKIFDDLGLSKEIRDGVMGGNVAKMFGLKD